METMTEFIFLGSKITADGDFSHEIKRHCLLGRKAMTKLDNVYKSRDITLLTKVNIVKAMLFPVVMYGCESWTMKAEWRRIDAFELWCWRRLLRVPCTAKRSNQSILKIITPKYSLEELMLKLQSFDHLIWRADSLEQTCMLAKLKAREGDERGWDGWMTSLTQHEFQEILGGGKGQGILVCWSPWDCKECDLTEWLNSNNNMHLST